MGVTLRSTMPILMWRVSSVMMQKRVISLAVPAVVLMATRAVVVWQSGPPLVVGNLAAVGGAQGNALGAVVRASRRQRDHEVALLGLQAAPARRAHCPPWGWAGCHQTPPGNLLPGQLGLDARRHAELAEHGVGNDQRLTKAVTLQGPPWLPADSLRP